MALRGDDFLGIQEDGDHIDHAAYIGSWLKVLKNDKRAIFSAAAHAQRAVDYLHDFQAKEKKTN